MTAIDRSNQYPEPPSTIDSHRYTDPDQYRREIEAIFHRAWLRICPAGDLAASGDYVLWEEIGQSLVVARQEDGAIAGWHNVCQHRGARLVEASGHCESGRIVCPWHGFIYDLKGRLRIAPLRKEFDEALIATLRLPPVRVEEYGGFVWACLSEETAPLKDYLGDIGAELDWFGLENFETRYRFDLMLDANWKVVVDAFNETWHVPYTHRDTLSEVVQWSKAHLRICDPHSWMSIPVKGLTDRLPDDADHRASHITHYLAFPSTFYSNFPTHLQSWSVWPAGPRRAHLVAYGLVGPCPEGLTPEQWAKRNARDWQNFLDVTTEDAAIINGWGKVAGSLGQGDYMFNRAEGRLTAFHREVARRTDRGD